MKGRDRWKWIRLISLVVSGLVFLTDGILGVMLVPLGNEHASTVLRASFTLLWVLAFLALGANILELASPGRGLRRGVAVLSGLFGLNFLMLMFPSTGQGSSTPLGLISIAMVPFVHAGIMLSYPDDGRQDKRGAASTQGTDDDQDH